MSTKVVINESPQYKLSVTDGTDQTLSVTNGIELQVTANVGGQGPAGPNEITTATDVAVSNPVTGQSLIYDSEDQLWKNGGITAYEWYNGDPEPLNQNAVALQIEASGAVTEGQPIPNNISITITYSGYIGTHSYTLNLTSSTVFDSTVIATSLASGLQTVIQGFNDSIVVYSYQNYVAINYGSFNFITLSGTSLTCNYGTVYVPANISGGVIQYCNYIPSLLGDFIIDASGGIRQWECSSVNPIIWTEITNEALTVSSNTDILRLGANNTLIFSLAFGDGIGFEDQTNAISCNPNIARRAGSQTFTGNNFFGASNIPVSTSFFGTQTFNGNRTLAGASTFSGQVELTGQTATNSTSAINRSLGDTRYRGVYSTTSIAVQSFSDVLESVQSITLPVGVYELSAFIASSHDSVAGCKIRLGTTNNIRVGLTDNYGRPSVAAFSESIILEDYNNTTPLATRTDTGGTAYRRTITGIIEVITPNTVISLDYAQAVSTPEKPSLVRARRYLIARPIG